MIDHVSRRVGDLPTGRACAERAGARELHLALAAPDRPSLAASGEAARSIGAEILHEPRLFPECGPANDRWIVRDPDARIVEAVCPGEGRRPDAC